MRSSDQPAGSTKKPPCRWKSAGARIAAAILAFHLCSPGNAEAGSGPFDGLDGVWSGTGTISVADGTKERLRCRVQYLVQRDGTNLQQALRCSSDSYQFQVNAYVNADKGMLSGNWTEVTRNVSGRITGHADKGRIQVSVAMGGAFSAKMSMTTSGKRQSVTIQPKGTDVTQVSVTLTKGK